MHAFAVAGARIFLAMSHHAKIVFTASGEMAVHSPTRALDSLIDSAHLDVPLQDSNLGL